MKAVYVFQHQRETLRVFKVKNSGGALDYGVVFYVDRDDSKLYSLIPDWNSDDTLLIRQKTPDQPEHGSQKPQSRSTG